MENHRKYMFFFNVAEQICPRAFVPRLLRLPPSGSRLMKTRTTPVSFARVFISKMALCPGDFGLFAQSYKNSGKSPLKRPAIYVAPP